MSCIVATILSATTFSTTIPAESIDWIPFTSMLDQPSDEITYHYIKANDFRVVPATGVWGGATPAGYINMAFFTERVPMPKTLTHHVTADHRLGEETDRDTLEGIIRDVHVNVMIDRTFAVSLRAWLDEKIQFIEAQATEPRQTEDTV